MVCRLVSSVLSVTRAAITRAVMSIVTLAVVTLAVAGGGHFYASDASVFSIFQTQNHRDRAYRTRG